MVVYCVPRGATILATLVAVCAQPLVIRQPVAPPAAMDHRDARVASGPCRGEASGLDDPRRRASSEPAAVGRGHRAQFATMASATVGPLASDIVLRGGGSSGLGADGGPGQHDDFHSSPRSETTTDDNLQIGVRNSCGLALVLDIDKRATLEALHKRIEERSATPQEEVILYRNRERLSRNEDTLETRGVEWSDTLFAEHADPSVPVTFELTVVIAQVITQTLAVHTHDTIAVTKRMLLSVPEPQGLGGGFGPWGGGTGPCRRAMESTLPHQLRLFTDGREMMNGEMALAEVVYDEKKVVYFSMEQGTGAPQGEQGATGEQEQGEQGAPPR